MKVEDAACPKCGHKTLVITEERIARPAGDSTDSRFFSVSALPVLWCLGKASCGFRVVGEYDNPDHIAFPAFEVTA